MFARCLCACCALVSLVSPAAADFIVNSDYTIDASNVPPISNEERIIVNHNATLTIQNSPDGTVPNVLGDLLLTNHSSLRLLGGKINGDITANGTNTIELRGGSHRNSINGTGDVHVILQGDMQAGSNFQFSSGTQVYDVYSFQLHPTAAGPEIYMGGEDDIVNVYSPRPDFYKSSPWSHLGEFCFQPHFCGDIAVNSQIPWRIYDTTGRPNGDANLDGVVDLQDLNIIRGAIGQIIQSSEPNGSTAYGDTLPYDGKVSLDDLNVVRNNFGATSAQPVPEPASLVLMATGCIALSYRFAKSRHCSHRQKRLP